MGPMEEMLRAAQGRVRFHMPGHKGRLGAVDSALDMTELDATDELYAPHSGIARAERLLARAADAQASILVPGGATAGLLALILAFVPAGRPAAVFAKRPPRGLVGLRACRRAGDRPAPG